MVRTGSQTRRGGSATTVVTLMSTRSFVVACACAALTLPARSLAAPRPTAFFAPVSLALPSRARVESAWLRPHLDRTRALVGADRARASNGTALTGRHALVGLIDSGVDVAHPDLRDAEGRTRIAWMLDYASPPRGAHPDLEARFAVETADGLRGAVWSRDDLDAALASGAAPDDPIGHGTHALSIALGDDVRYTGVAPEADAVVVRASLRRDRAEVPEALAATAAAFVFDRADALSLPAVVALSLGTHRGAHDGDSALERSLAALVDRGDAPGRALVVSAGNGGGRRLHARMELARGATLPLTLRLGAHAGVVGVSLASRSALTVAPRWPDGTLGSSVTPGLTRASRNPDDGSRVTLSNALDGASPVTGARVVDAVFDGPGGAYTLLLSGEGRVDAWIYLDGNAASAADLPAFEAPYGDEECSVEAPATSRSVIAVGALSTRIRWLDALGATNARTGAIEGEVAPFSARGPSAAWALKPDLVAPGDVVIAALSARAATSLTSPFSDPHLAVDTQHAAASGTSAAAPHVAGAIALLFEERPRATQRELAAALTAGASVWGASRGWSSLDIPRALSALHGSSPGARASRDRSSCALSATGLVRGERVVIACRALADDGAPADATFDARATAGRFETPSPQGLGRYELAYEAPWVGDRVTLTLALDGATLSQWTLPLTAGPGRDASESAGGCSAPNHRSRPRSVASLAALLMAWCGRRRRMRA